MADLATTDIKEYKRQWYQKNKERILTKRKSEYEANPESHLARMSAYRKTEAGRAAKKRAYDKWAAGVESTYKIRGRRSSRHHGDVLKGDEWNDFVLQEIYELVPVRRKETGMKWAVDHIVPLNGARVSGLHVWYNLQLIPFKANAEKHNTFYEESAIYEELK